MADETTDPHDDKVRTVPLPTDDGAGERVIAQENQSPEVAMGGGEWPPTDTPPTGPSPGTGEERPDHGPGRLPGDTVDGPPGTGAGQGDGFPPVKDVLEADPVSAGSSSVPEEDGRRDTAGTRFS